MRRLIINADDFGLTAGVNRAIFEAHTSGALTSTTLMANSAAFEDAVARAKSAPALSVGCHVVLVDGAPVLERSQVPSLLNSSGEFHFSVVRFAARAMAGRLDHDQVVNEIVAQIHKIQAAGIQVSHLDTHKHAHLFPPILVALIRAAKICGVPAIRNPFIPVQAIRASWFRGKPGLWKRYAQVRMLGALGSGFGEKMKRAGLVAPDGVLGVIETGSFDHSLLRQVLANLPDGTWELVCHPGYDDADLAKVRTRLHESRDKERRLLVSAELREFLDREQIQLISYRQL